jgi:hypothetical protein
MKKKSARKPANTVAPADILNDHGVEISSLAEKLRTVVRSSMPEALESGHPVWHSIGYRHPTAGYVCGIFPRKEYVDLVFEFGVLLSDPTKVLQGGGKQVRYLRFTEGDVIREETVKQLIQDALSLPESRAIKLDLIRSKARMIR